MVVVYESRGLGVVVEVKMQGRVLWAKRRQLPKLVVTREPSRWIWIGEGHWTRQTWEL